MRNHFLRATGKALWTPAQITTGLWLDAADANTVTTVSGAVSQWNDKSGNGRNFTQATSGSRPTYTSAVLNALNTVTPDGSNDFLEGPVVFSGTQPDNYFIITAIRVLSIINSGNNAGNAFIYQSTGDVAWNINLNLANTGSANVSSTDSYPPSGGFLNSATATQANTSYLFATSRTSGTRSIWINGQVDATQSSAETYSGPSVTKVGLFGLNAITGAPGFYNALNAHVGEIVMLAYPTDANRQRIEGYLAHKWGLTANLPAGHPYKSAPPT
jgi:hypothetical protein